MRFLHKYTQVDPKAKWRVIQFAYQLMYNITLKASKSTECGKNSLGFSCNIFKVCFLCTFKSLTVKTRIENLKEAFYTYIYVNIYFFLVFPLPFLFGLPSHVCMLFAFALLFLFTLFSSIHELIFSVLKRK